MQDNKPHILIVESPYYTEISNFLAKGAIDYLNSKGATFERLDVPGALEIPPAIKFAKVSEQFDGFIALGCVIRGETSHYDIVCNASAGLLTQLSIDYDLALGNGILTCENKEQAIRRADPAQKNKGRDAAEAALRMIEVKKLFRVF